MSRGVRESLQDCIDGVLTLRGELGLNLHPVSFVERTWSGGERDRGEVTKETVTEMWPAPRIVDLSHNFRLLEGGNYQQGDLMLRQISKNQFPKEEMLSMVTDSRAKERFILIDGKRYTVISIRERLLWWDLQIRKQAGGNDG